MTPEERNNLRENIRETEWFAAAVDCACLLSPCRVASALSPTVSNYCFGVRYLKFFARNKIIARDSTIADKGRSLEILWQTFGQWESWWQKKKVRSLNENPLNANSNNSNMSIISSYCHYRHRQGKKRKKKKKKSKCRLTVQWQW